LSGGRDFDVVSPQTIRLKLAERMPLEANGFFLIPGNFGLSKIPGKS